MKPGRPVLIEGLTKDWGATKKFASNGGISLDWQSLLESYGDRIVPVTKEDGECEHMTLQEFKERAQKEHLYLKDWHFVQENELTEKVYK